MMTTLNRRTRTVIYSVIAIVLLVIPVLLALLQSSSMLDTHLTERNQAPSLAHPFGTDWLGRDMLARTMKGLVLSLGVGLTAALASGMIAAVLGLMAASLGRTVDRIITWLIDLFLSVPHLVLLILLAFVMGGGVKGVIIAVGLTHWPSLARLIRAEIMYLKTSEFVLISEQMGRSKWWIATRHLLPHLLPSLLLGHSCCSRTRFCMRPL